jgi:hypothetical protein
LLPLQSILPLLQGLNKKMKENAYDCSTYDPDYLLLLHRVSHLFMGMK